MLITTENLKGLLNGYRDEFNGGFDAVEAVYPTIANTVNSNTSQEIYAWLLQFPKLTSPQLDLFDHYQ